MYSGIKCNRDTRVKRAYRNGVLLFLAGTATGAFTTFYFMKKNHKDILETVSTQAGVIAKLDDSNKKKLEKIKNLDEKNEALYYQNQELWREHARILKRRNRTGSFKEIATREDKNKQNPLIEPVEKNLIEKTQKTKAKDGRK